MISSLVCTTRVGWPLPLDLPESLAQRGDIIEDSPAFRVERSAASALPELLEGDGGRDGGHTSYFLTAGVPAPPVFSA